MSLPVSRPKFSLVAHLLTGVGHPKCLLLMVPRGAQIVGLWGAVGIRVLAYRASQTIGQGNGFLVGHHLVSHLRLWAHDARPKGARVLDSSLYQERSLGAWLVLHRGACSNY